VSGRCGLQSDTIHTCTVYVHYLHALLHEAMHALHLLRTQRVLSIHTTSSSVINTTLTMVAHNSVTHQLPSVVKRTHVQTLELKRLLMTIAHSSCLTSSCRCAGGSALLALLPPLLLLLPLLPDAPPLLPADCAALSCSPIVIVCLCKLQLRLLVEVTVKKCV
jgi:hypothetical protein